MNVTPKELGYRPWGSYVVLVDKPTHKVKSIVVNPEQRLSLQSHKLRKEFWTIVDGTGVFTSGYDADYLDTQLVTIGDTLEIPAGMLHRIQAGLTGITFIEVQLGAYFGEDDIERFEDDYERTNQ